MSGSGGGEVADADASEPERPDVSDGRAQMLRIVFGSTHRLTPLAPSDGGSPYNDSCEPDGVVIGARGTNDPNPMTSFTTAPRSIQTLCDTVSIMVTGTGAYGVTTSLKTILAQHGDHPGPVSEDGQCPDNMVVVGVETRAGMFVDLLRFQCAPLTVSGGPDVYTLSTGAISYPRMDLGGPGGSPAAPLICPSGEVVTALYPNAGDFIDSFTIGCAKPSIVFEP